MIVLLLTEAEKDLIQGQEFAPSSFFNCVQDINDKWVVSIEELVSLDGSQYAWLYTLPMSIHQPKIYNLPI
jgi:hypothetical protein